MDPTEHTKLAAHYAKMAAHYKELVEDHNAQALHASTAWEMADFLAEHHKKASKKKGGTFGMAHPRPPLNFDQEEMKND
jgi:hypothetical protein